MTPENLIQLAVQQTTDKFKEKSNTNCVRIFTYKNAERKTISSGLSYNVNSCMGGLKNITNKKSIIVISYPASYWEGTTLEEVFDAYAAIVPGLSRHFVPEHNMPYKIVIDRSVYASSAACLQMTQVFRLPWRNSREMHMLNETARYLKQGLQVILSTWLGHVTASYFKNSNPGSNNFWNWDSSNFQLPVTDDEFVDNVTNNDTLNTARSTAMRLGFKPTYSDVRAWNKLKKNKSRQLTDSNSKNKALSIVTLSWLAVELNGTNNKKIEYVLEFLDWVKKRNSKKVVHIYRHRSHKGLITGIKSPADIIVRTGIKTKEVREGSNLEKTTFSNTRYPIVINCKYGMEKMACRTEMKKILERTSKPTNNTPNYLTLEDNLMYKNSYGTERGMGNYYRRPERLRRKVEEVINSGELRFPLVAKREYGSGGIGMLLFRNTEEDKKKFWEWLEAYANSRNIITGKVTKLKRFNPYVLENYHNYGREFRIHVHVRDGVFFATEKRRKLDLPENERWYFNSKNSAFFREFEEPEGWGECERQLKQFLSLCNATYGAADVRFKKKDNGKEFMIIELNSSPSFGDMERGDHLTKDAYKAMLKKEIRIRESKCLS